MFINNTFNYISNYCFLINSFLTLKYDIYFRDRKRKPSYGQKVFSLKGLIGPVASTKGDNWVFWILNCHVIVYDINTALIPSSSTESVIHYGDLIWNTCQTRLGWGNVEDLSWDSWSSQKKCLNVELELALAAIKKCLTLLHDNLGPDTK